MTQPCECGLDRPWRLFGRSDNRTQAAPRSKTGSMTPEMFGLACVLNLAGFAPVGNWEIQEDGAMESTTKKKTTNKFSPEVRARAVRMVREHRGDHSSQWAAIASIAAKIGCTGETLRNWVRQEERDTGARAGATTSETERIKGLERENRELRQANEILRKASAYFAMAELDRRSKS
jgi:transposase